MAVSRPIPGVALAIVVGLSLTACGAGSRASTGAGHSDRSFKPVAAGLERVPAFGHLFVVVGENTSASEVTRARMPYLTGTIRPRSAWLTRYFALTDGSLGNYGPRHVILAVLGAAVKPGTYGGGRFTHYSLLRTIEDGFGVRRHLAHAARAAPLSQIWK